MGTQSFQDLLSKARQDLKHGDFKALLEVIKLLTGEIHEIKAQVHEGLAS